MKINVYRLPFKKIIYMWTWGDDGNRPQYVVNTILRTVESLMMVTWYCNINN